MTHKYSQGNQNIERAFILNISKHNQLLKKYIYLGNGTSFKIHIAHSLKSTTAATIVGGPKTLWEDQRSWDLKKGRMTKADFKD